MGNSVSPSYTKDSVVVLTAPHFRQLFVGHLVANNSKVSIFSYGKDTSLSPFIPNITENVRQRALSSRKIDGLVDILHTEVSDQGLELVVEHVRPLMAIDKFEMQDVLLGLYHIGRALHRFHTVNKLSHNCVSLGTIFVNSKTDQWLLTEELLCDLKSEVGWQLATQTTNLLDSSFVPPEFQSNPSQIKLNKDTYPIHARDSYSFAQLVLNFDVKLNIARNASARQILKKMSSSDPMERPTINTLLQDPLFSNNVVIKIVSQLMDIKHGLLDAQQAQILFQETLPNLLSILPTQTVIRSVLDHIVKYSVIIHPLAASRFLPMLFTVKAKDNLNENHNQKTRPIGLLPLSQYNASVKPFIEKSWTQDRPGLSVALLKTIGRYIHRLDEVFIRDVISNKIISLNLLMEADLPKAFLTAMPIIVKHQLRKNYDASPLVRHLIDHVDIFAAVDENLRIKALTCLFVYHRIPILLLKEYINKGITDKSANVRRSVVNAVKKFGIAFGDNGKPMTARCIAEGLISSLIPSLIDVDAVVREKARNAIRKLTFVIERKENLLAAPIAQSTQNKKPNVPKSSTKSTTKSNVSKSTTQATFANSNLKSNLSDNHDHHETHEEFIVSNDIDKPKSRIDGENSDFEAQNASSSFSENQESSFNYPANESSWNAWDDWEDEPEGDVVEEMDEEPLVSNHFVKHQINNKSDQNEHHDLKLNHNYDHFKSNDWNDSKSHVSDGLEEEEQDRIISNQSNQNDSFLSPSTKSSLSKLSIDQDLNDSAGWDDAWASETQETTKSVREIAANDQTQFNSNTNKITEKSTIPAIEDDDVNHWGDELPSEVEQQQNNSSNVQLKYNQPDDEQEADWE